jgi:hypothetical protein
VTGARCAHCPAAEGLSCRGGGFCAWAADGDPVHLRHIAAVALRDAGRPTPQPAVPCQDAPAPQPAPTPAEWLAQVPSTDGKPCCGGQPPGLLAKAGNFARAAFEHVAAGSPEADEPTASARLAICLGCEHLNAHAMTCNICGCSMPKKVYWLEQHCPIEKW